MVFEIFDFRKSFENVFPSKKTRFRILLVVFIFWSYLMPNPCKRHRATPPVPPTNVANAPPKIRKCRKSPKLLHFGLLERFQDFMDFGDFSIFFAKPAPLAVLQIPLPASAACLECVQGCLRLLQLSGLLQNRFGKNIFFENFETRKFLRFFSHFFERKSLFLRYRKNDRKSDGFFNFRFSKKFRKRFSVEKNVSGFCWQFLLF